MDSRPGANVENVETCLAGRAHLSPAEPDLPSVFAGFVWVPGHTVAKIMTARGKLMLFGPAVRRKPRARGFRVPPNRRL